MTALAEDLLTLARADAGLTADQLVPVDLAAIARRARGARAPGGRGGRA